MPMGETTPLAIPERFNLTTQLLDRNVARGLGDRPALLHPGGSVTYEALLQMVNRTGRFLRDLGVEPEQRVLIAADTTVEAVVTWLAAVRIGAVAVAVNFFGGPELLDYFLRDTGATVAVVDPPLAGSAKQWLEQHPRLKAVVSLGAATAPAIPFAQAQTRPAEMQVWDTGCDDPAFWIYSSGSTGKPKGCVHLHHDLMYHVEGAAGAVIPCGPGDVCFSPAKLFFGIGLAEAVWRPLAFGAAAVLTTGRTTPTGFMEIVQRYQATEVFSIPTLYSHVLGHVENPGAYDVSSVRRWIAGGEPLPAAVSEAWEQAYGLPIDVAFGSNESGFLYFLTYPGQRKPGSSGVLLPGVQVRILGDDGREVSPGQVGELYVRHDAFAALYWGKHEATKRNMQGEWFKSGDMFYVDDDGHYFFCGRNDDLFKVSGQWVSPVEIEAKVNEHPAVVEAVVMGVQNADGLVEGQAFLLLAPGAAPDTVVGEVRTRLADRLPRYKVPTRYTVVAELPRTGTGKVDRRRLAEGTAAGG